jgi:hypothetical protein
MDPSAATTTSGADPAALLWVAIWILLLVIGGIWADRVDREAGER